uniref:Uncharacterized protein n=1 Tax=Ciona intestinalis TaxID=7719 RepID=H2XMY2_CIOIN
MTYAPKPRCSLSSVSRCLSPGTLSFYSSYFRPVIKTRCSTGLLRIFIVFFYFVFLYVRLSVRLFSKFFFKKSSRDITSTTTRTQ